MRVVVLAVGSRGDVEPFVALCARLQACGHQARLATSVEFHHLARRYDVDVAELPGNPRELLSSAAGQATLNSRNPLRVMRRLGGLVAPTIEAGYSYALQAADGADLLIFSTLALVGLNVADRLGIPAVSAQLQPANPTQEFPAAALPVAHWPRPLNRFSWTLTETVAWRVFAPVLNAQRRRLGLAELPRRIPSRWTAGRRPPGLFGYSPTLAPVPADWGGDIHVTGSWFLDPPPGWQPPTDLVAFLAAGDAPVYLGFGSMPGADPEQTSRILVEAARRVGRRAVLNAGWAGLSVAEASDVLVVDDLPHSWLLPRMAAVVHHGGAGTTAAGLRAGRPTVVIPHFVDQFFWGRQVARLGAGPAPLRRPRLTVDLLAERLGLALRPEVAQAAASVRDRMRHEDGPGEAVRVLEQLVG